MKVKSSEIASCLRKFCANADRLLSLLHAANDPGDCQHYSVLTREIANAVKTVAAARDEALISEISENSKARTARRFSVKNALNFLWQN